MNISASAPVASPSNFITSRVRVDNLQNIAILEYRNSDGHVVRQYPTEAQIEAFRRAEALQQEHAQEAHQQAAQRAPAPRQGSAPASTHSAPAPAQSAPVSAPSPAAAAAAAASYVPAASADVADGGTGGGGGGSSQSVVV